MLRAGVIIIIIVLVSLFSGGEEKVKKEDCTEFVTRSGRKKPDKLTRQDSLYIQIKYNLKIIEAHIDKK